MPETYTNNTRAVARVLGWRRTEKEFGEPGHRFVMKGWENSKTGKFYCYLPRYSESLDLMHEAEEELNEKQRETYLRLLKIHNLSDWELRHAKPEFLASIFLDAVLLTVNNTIEPIVGKSVDI